MRHQVLLPCGTLSSSSLFPTTTKASHALNGATTSTGCIQRRERPPSRLSFPGGAFPWKEGCGKSISAVLSLPPRPPTFETRRDAEKGRRRSQRAQTVHHATDTMNLFSSTRTSRTRRRWSWTGCKHQHTPRRALEVAARRTSAAA